VPTPAKSAAIAAIWSPRVPEAAISLPVRGVDRFVPGISLGLSMDRLNATYFIGKDDLGGAVPFGRRSCPAERREAGASDFLPLGGG
jgi:hypothetical protein